MADRVDAVMNSMKPFTRRSPLDRAVIDARLAKLLDGYDSVLPRSETIDRPIEVSR